VFAGWMPLVSHSDTTNSVSVLREIPTLTPARQSRSVMLCFLFCYRTLEVRSVGASVPGC